MHLSLITSSFISFSNRRLYPTQRHSPLRYGCQALFSQGSPSSSFAVLLSSGFHFSILFAKLRNSAFSPSLSHFSTSSNVPFGTSASPLQFPADRCAKTFLRTVKMDSKVHTILIKPTPYAIPFQEIPSEVARARRSYAQGDRHCPVDSPDLQWCRTNFRPQAGPRPTILLSALVVT